MCGLLGHSFTKGFQSQVTVPQYMVLMSILANKMDARGGHSWGVARWPDGQPWQKPKVMKDLGDMAVQMHRRFTYVPTTCIGHTRYKTTGDITVENAHPFLIGNILGAHNGVVYNHTSLETQRGLKWSVDSQAIFHYIQEGWDLKELQAYGAITYANLKEPDRVYLSRFNNGDLTVMGLGDQDNTLGIVWASTELAAKDAIAAAGWDSISFRYEIKENHLYVVENGSLFLLNEEVGIKKNYAELSRASYYGGSYRGPHRVVDQAKSTTSTTGPITRWKEGDLVDEQNIFRYGMYKLQCDLCNAQWAYFYEGDKLYLCQSCFGEYFEDALNGNYSEILEGRGYRTRAEVAAFIGH